MQLQLFENNPKPETRHEPVFDGSHFFVRTVRFQFSHSCHENLIDSLIYIYIFGLVRSDQVIQKNSNSHLSQISRFSYIDKNNQLSQPDY
jgi:hypothetical protein